MPRIITNIDETKADPNGNSSPEDYCRSCWAWQEDHHADIETSDVGVEHPSYGDGDEYHCGDCGDLLTDRDH